NDESITGNAEAERQLAITRRARFTEGLTTRVGSQTPQETFPRSSNVALDAEIISKYAPDKTGVRTTAHELYHVMGIAGGFSDPVVRKGDQPTNHTGPAEAFGKLVQQE